MTLGEFAAAALRRWTFRGIRVPPLIIITYREDHGHGRRTEGTGTKRGPEKRPHKIIAARTQRITVYFLMSHHGTRGPTEACHFGWTIAMENVKISLSPSTASIARSPLS